MTVLSRPTLSPSWRLTVDGPHAFVERRSDHQRVAALTAFEAVALSLLDGSRGRAEVTAALGEVYGGAADTAVTSLTTRLAALLIEGRARRSHAPAAYPMTVLARLQRPGVEAGMRSAPGPSVLHWWVTSYCPRRCEYCFAEPIHGTSAPDATLPRARLREIFQEARSLGTRSLLVAGAEPLLRHDLPEVLGDAIEVGIAPYLTTKHPISGALAARFAQAGLKHLSISLDSMRDDVNADVLGDRSFASQVRRSTDNLRNAGIAFSFQAVACELNPDDFVDVVAFAEQQGARVVQVVPYEPVLHPIGRHSVQALSLRARDQLEERLLRVRRLHPGVDVQLFKQAGEDEHAAYHCDIGMTKLFFLSDGRVHRCYKLRHDPRLMGRSLLESSVAAAWHDPGFAPVISPPREHYAGSACHDCGRFDTCHTDGRCIYQAYADHGRYHAPDRACAAPGQRRRLPVMS